MKKVTMIFAVLALMAGTSAFANSGDKVSKAVKVEFQKDFSNAEHVTWEIEDEFYFASFKLNGENVDAAYNEKGELLGTSRKLQLADIPINVTAALKSNYAGYVIGNTVTEVVFEGETFYYATATGVTRDLKLKCLSNGQVSVEKKIKK